MSFFLAAMILAGTATATLISASDYTFVSATEITAHSWTFDLSVLNPSWSSPPGGIVLSYNYYDMNSTNVTRSVNYISPTDILIGNGVESGAFNLTHVDTYTCYGGIAHNMTFSWSYRQVNISFIALASQESAILLSLENFHCIAGDSSILDRIENVTAGMPMQLTGYIVNVYGYKGNESVSWTTDYYAQRAQNGTIFGSTHCDIIVISNTVPVVQPDLTGDVIIATVIVLIAVTVGITTFYVARSRQRRSIDGCKIDKMKRGFSTSAFKRKERYKECDV